MTQEEIELPPEFGEDRELDRQVALLMGEEEAIRKDERSKIRQQVEAVKQVNPYRDDCADPYCVDPCLKQSFRGWNAACDAILKALGGQP
jgi:hypothetical protein